MDDVIIYRRLTETQADACALVLASAGIGHRASRRWNGWSVTVAESDAGMAVAHIEQYMAENEASATAPDAESTAASGHRSWCGIWMACLLMAIHLWLTSSGRLTDAQHALGASAAHIMAGDWYRCTTALLVHADALHLLGNMLGLAVFGTAVCLLTGGGVGALLVSATGVLGNLLNALVYRQGHLSIGASTAVFGALGILAVYQLVSRLQESGGGYRAWVPLGAGLALLGLLGSGAHVDIMAHLFGFIIGGLTGALLKWRWRIPAARRYQVIAFVITAGWFAAAWLAAWPGMR